MEYKKVVIGGEEFMIPKLATAGNSLIIIGLVLVTLIWSSFYSVGPDEVGVVLRFGKYVRTTQSGLHMKMPFGIEQVDKPKIRKRFTQEFGFRTIKAGVQSKITKSGFGNESLMLTGDLNSAVVNWIVQYQIKDPMEFLFNVRKVEGTIRDISEVAMRQTVGDRSVDEILTFGRGEINQEVQKVMQEILDSYGIGVQVVLVNLQDVDPPPSVKSAFDEVNAATQDMDRLIQEARREFNESVPRAKGRAEKQVRQAEAYAVERINIAEGEANRFISVYNEYRKAKKVTRRRMYLETLADVLPKIENKWIVESSDNGILKLLDLNMKKGVK